MTVSYEHQHHDTSLFDDVVLDVAPKMRSMPLLLFFDTPRCSLDCYTLVVFVCSAEVSSTCILLAYMEEASQFPRHNKEPPIKACALRLVHDMLHVGQLSGSGGRAKKRDFPYTIHECMETKTRPADGRNSGHDAH